MKYNIMCRGKEYFAQCTTAVRDHFFKKLLTTRLNYP